MTLYKLIEILKTLDSKMVANSGFDNPHSYRGYYEQLAFEPCGPRTVRQLLKTAESAIGKTYQGYKGGKFTMSLDTDVWISDYGSCASGDNSLNESELAAMFGLESFKEITSDEAKDLIYAINCTRKLFTNTHPNAIDTKQEKRLDQLKKKLENIIQ